MRIRTWWTLVSLIFAVVLLAACGADDATYEDRMAEEHKDDTPEASPATERQPAVPVVSEEVVYAHVDGQDVTGYLARPAASSTDTAEGEPAAVIVIHEWWGLNDNIRSMADQLAGEGYLALAVDLYGGTSAEAPEDALALATAVRENPEPAAENLRQARAFLGEQGAAKVGSIGWCFGGGWSLRTALAMPGEIDAAVIYYGRVTDDRDELAVLETPILGIFGAEDRGIEVDGVRAFKAALEELGKDAAIHIYDGADHAFANPSGGSYNETAAADAWEKTVAFLAAHLKG